MVHEVPGGEKKVEVISSGEEKINSIVITSRQLCGELQHCLG